MVLYGYTFALMPLFESSRQLYDNGLLWLEKFSLPESRANLVVKYMAWLIRIVVVHILLSKVFEILELTAWFVGGVIWSGLQDRQAGQNLIHYFGQQDENVMGFAQFVAIILFLLPFLVVVETFSGKRLCKRD